MDNDRIASLQGMISTVYETSTDPDKHGDNIQDIIYVVLEILEALKDK